jgi:hypothetical protein
MAFQKKKIYKIGSPGWNRQDKKITLTLLQAMIRKSSNPMNARREYRREGLIG